MSYLVLMYHTWSRVTIGSISGVEASSSHGRALAVSVTTRLLAVWSAPSSSVPLRMGSPL